MSSNPARMFQQMNNPNWLFAFYTHFVKGTSGRCYVFFNFDCSENFPSSQ